MTDENDLVSVTIHVDTSKGVKLDHECARCGAKARSVATSYDCMDRATGQTDPQVFFVRNAMPPEGWEHIRVPDPENPYGKSVEVQKTLPFSLDHTR